MSYFRIKFLHALQHIIELNDCVELFSIEFMRMGPDLESTWICMNAFFNF